MTFEEAKEVFLNRGLVYVVGGALVDGDKWREACYVISQWLKQQPCEDAISREAVQDLIATWLSDYLTKETREVLETIVYKIGDMPSVYPK